MTPCPVCEGFRYIEAPPDDSRTVVHECWRCEGSGWIDDDDEEDGPGESLVPAPDPPTGGQAWADWNAELMRRLLDEDDEEAP